MVRCPHTDFPSLVVQTIMWMLFNLVHFKKCSWAFSLSWQPLMRKRCARGDGRSRKGDQDDSKIVERGKMSDMMRKVMVASG